MIRVVPLEEVLREFRELQAHDLETLALEAPENLADEAALDAVGLDEDEGGFHGGHAGSPEFGGAPRTVSDRGRSASSGATAGWTA